MITQDKIIEIRNRASIVEIISDYVTLKKAGRNHMGLCPFHAEKTPSFTVNEEKGIFHCFGCQTGGSVFQFLMQLDQLTFPEAVERVAKRYGITIERAENPRARAESGERDSLYHINERAAANYHRILLERPEGRKALDYLKARGLDESVTRRFMLGYAPPSGSGLIEFVKQGKLPPKDALRLGLIGQRNSDQFYEKFFGRLMFPIINAAGKVVGFGGRVLDQGMPKYLNSSETPLFHKSSTLYGLFQAKEGIRKTDRVVLVEGYLDAIALFQYGIPYAVATLGTALTVDHVRLLARYTKNIIALFDGDDAGRKAAARSFEIFIEAGLLGRAALLPKGEDPDTFVRSGGKAVLEQMLDQAPPLADYYFSWLEERYGKSLEGKSQTAGEISRLLAKVVNPFEADLLIRRAVDSLGIREESLRLARPSSSVKRRPSQPAIKLAPAAGAPLRDGVAERSLVSLMLRFDFVMREFDKQKEARQWMEPRWREVVDVVAGEWQQQGRVDVFQVAQKLAPDRGPEIAALAIEGETISETEAGQMATDCLAHLRRKYLKNLERNLRIAIRAAEEQQDEYAKRERILEWQDVVREERQLERRKLEAKITIR
jgi:DNA primase